MNVFLNEFCILGGQISGTHGLQKQGVKRPRKPKKLKLPKGEFTLSSGTTPLPPSLLSISTPLPPMVSKDTDPPPLPIRIPLASSTGPPVASPSSPTPRVIHYAGRSEAGVTTPTWTGPAPRPAAGQLILSTLPRPGLSPTKLVSSGQGSVSPRSSSGTVQIQLPSPGHVRQVAPGHISPGSVRHVAPGSVRHITPGSIRQVTPGHSPEKLLILMSPGKDGAPQSVSPVKDMLLAPGKVLPGHLRPGASGLMVSTSPRVSPVRTPLPSPGNKSAPSSSATTPQPSPTKLSPASTPVPPSTKSSPTN